MQCFIRVPLSNPIITYLSYKPYFFTISFGLAKHAVAAWSCLVVASKTCLWCKANGGVLAPYKLFLTPLQVHGYNSNLVPQLQDVYLTVCRNSLHRYVFDTTKQDQAATASFASPRRK
jgi:hypothetical protein